MPDIIKEGPARKRSRVLNKIVNLSLTEQQAKYRYLKMDMDVFNLAGKESWAELAELSKQGRGNAITTLARLRGMARLAMIMPYEAADLRKTFSTPGFRQGFEKYMAESGGGAALIDSYLNKANYKKIADAPKDSVSNTLSEQGAYAVATGFTGYWAGFFSEFNLACKKAKPIRFTQLSDLETMMNFISEQNKFIWSLLFMLKDMLAEEKPAKIHQKSMNILLLLEEQLVWLPDYAAKVYASLEKARSEEKTKLAHALAKIDLNIGILARRWAFVAAAALHTAYIGTLGESDKAYKEAKKNSKNLPRESKIPYGENVALKKLAVNGGKYHSRHIRVSGFVSNVGVSRKGGVYRTEFTLSDVTGAYNVQAIAVYENLAHHGMIDGSTAELSGFWEMASKIADYPIIKVDRLTLSQYKKESWLDYMTTVVRPWFDFYPNSHNISWSVRPEIKGGEIAKESNKTGAGEIEFNKTFLYKGGK